jgi:hypothetical protein bfra3_11596|nr:MAG TPA: hypothetical protein [Caudoviricetes sp.]
MNEFSFKLGFSQVKRKDVQEVKNRIMNALGLRTRVSWYARLNGAVEPKVSEAKIIESVFADFGITQVWGDED